MTEKNLEQKAIIRFIAALNQAELSGIQILGAWQTAESGFIKDEENPDVFGVLAVKAMPRQYATPTVADGTIQFHVAFTARADADPTGQSYIAAVEAISKVLQRWQKVYSEYYNDFNIADEFTPTGFTMDGGDITINQETKTWTWTQSFTLNGLICFNY